MAIFDMENYKFSSSFPSILIFQIAHEYTLLIIRNTLLKITSLLPWPVWVGWLERCLVAEGL